MSEALERAIGVHEAKIEGLQADVSEIKADVKLIRETLAEARGGWKTLMLVAGASGAVGAILGKLSGLLHIGIPIK
jgi:hypothetical protein